MNIVGTVGMILAVVLIFLPWAGPLLTLLTGTIAIFSPESRGWFIILVNLLNLLFFSPMLILQINGGLNRGDAQPLMIFSGLLLFQMICIGGRLSWSLRRQPRGTISAKKL